MRVVVLSLLAAAAWPFAAPAQSLDSRDWQVVCDNTRTCRAAGYRREQDAPAVSVLFTRQAGVRAPLYGELQLGQSGARPGSVKLVVGGKPGPTIALDRDNHGQLGGAVVEALLRALAGNASVAFVSGKTTWRLSGDGALAALSQMDEAQGRSGTAGALVRRGTLSDDNVKLPLATPTVRAVRIAGGPRPGDDDLANRIVSMIPHNDDCPLLDDGEARADPNDAPQLWHLDANRVLMSVTCWRKPPASGRGYWIANQRPPFAPHAVTLSGSGFDGVATLVERQKPGAGCASDQAWTWNGYDLELTASATGGLCRGVVDGGPWRLPTVIAEVIPAK
jgi:Protein of unknown function (DUF1176)